MSDDKKIKIYKNPKRNVKETYVKYVPQYQIAGVEPEEMKKTIVPPNMIAVKAKPSVDNPRLPRPAIRQSYAEVTNSPIGTGKSPVPNVGNNLEHTWAGINEELVDDLSDDMSNHPMIDNNEFVTNQALGLSEDDQLEVQEKLSLENNNLTEINATNEDIANIISNLDDQDYLLIINGTAVCSGTMEDIQDQTRLLVFGEHPICDGNPIPVDDIVIIKKIPIKVGLFIE